MSSFINNDHPELHQNIFSFLDIPDLEKCREVSSYFKANTDPVWREIAKRIQFPIEEESSDAYKQVKSYVKNLFRNIKSHLIPLPESIKAIVTQKKAPSIEDLKTLHSFLIDRSSAILLRQLSPQLDNPLGHIDWKNCNEKVPEFRTWCNDPKNVSELEKIDRLELQRLRKSIFLPDSMPLFVLPPELQKLKNLKTFACNGNYLGYIPPWIGTLDKLEKLQFSLNPISTPPSAIGELKNLKYLECDKTGISYLPDNWRKLANLQTLFLEYNQLKEVPDWMDELQELQDLDLVGNPVEKVPDTITKLNKLNEVRMSIPAKGVSPTTMEFIRSKRPSKFN